MLRAGIASLGDSRIDNIEKMRNAHIGISTTLIRSSMPSQVERVVMHADASLNTELDVISKLSAAAQEAGQKYGGVRQGPQTVPDISHQSDGYGSVLAARAPILSGCYCHLVSQEAELNRDKLE